MSDKSDQGIKKYIEPMGSKSFFEKSVLFFTESSKSVGKYIIGKVITSFLIGIIALIVFKIMDIELPWLLAVILGVTNLVPIVGPWVGLLICGIIVLFFTPIHAVYTTITALLLQLTEQFLLIPIIVGKAVDLKPMLIVCVLVIGSLIFGFWGVLLAIPIAAILKIWYNIFILKKRNSKKG